MEVGTGTSATSRRCWMCKPVGPAAQASGKDQMTESTLKLNIYIYITVVLDAINDE